MLMDVNTVGGAIGLFNISTFAIRLEQNCEEFSIYTEGTSARLHNIPLYQNPYTTRTLKGDIWELAWCRTDEILKALD